MAMNTHKNITIRGTVTTKDGGPAPGLTVAVMLLDYLPLGVGYEVASAVTGASGEYTATFDPSTLDGQGADDEAAALHVRVGTGTAVGSKEVFGYSGVYLAEAVVKGGARLDMVAPAELLSDSPPSSDGTANEPVPGADLPSNAANGETSEACARVAAALVIFLKNVYECLGRPVADSAVTPRAVAMANYLWLHEPKVFEGLLHDN